MNILTSREYNDRKSTFLCRHSGATDVDTSPMDEGGKYVKIYTCEDGAQLVEVNRPKWEKATVTVKGVTVEVEVKLFESEMWNTDDANSVFTYEKF